MKKYLATSILFLANNEIISMLALLIMAAMFLWSIASEAAKRGDL